MIGVLLCIRQSSSLTPRKLWNYVKDCNENIIESVYELQSTSLRHTEGKKAAQACLCRWYWRRVP